MNCPAEFKTKKTVNPLLLVIWGGVFWVLSAFIVFEILRHFFPPKEWMEVGKLVEKFALGLCLLYFIRELGINIYAVMQDWQKNRNKHLQIAVRYFLIYAGFMILAISVLVTIFILFEKTGMIEPSITANLAGKPDLCDGMGELKFLLENSIPRFILSLVSMCILAPIIEEIFFRRFLFVALRKKMNFTLALLISSILFMAVHPNMLLGAIGGIYLGYVYEKGKSLPANILIHSAVNFVTIAISMIM